MKLPRGLIFGLLIALGVGRMVAYLIYAWFGLPSPVEAFYLEAKMVLLAYRVEVGEALYPAWRDYPHVANFFGPAYFWAVGMLGVALRADIDGLFPIGRAISFASGLLTSLVVGGIVGRKYGRFAGFLGGVMTLGSAPMIGFSVMVRPDMTAELLGVCGFFLVARREWWGELAGGALLVLAIFTKQTTGVFLLAASLSWAAEGDWRRGLRLFVGCSVVAALVVAAGTILVEPNFAGSLAGEGKTPWEFRAFAKTFRRVVTLAPDLLIFSLLGLGIWTWGPAGLRDGRLAILAAVLLASSVGLSAKRGADLNYYLSLRVVEGLAVGVAWRAWSPAIPSRSRAMMAATVLGVLSLALGVGYAFSNASHERNNVLYLESSKGREFLVFHRQLYAAARNPGSRILTDSGPVDLHRGKLAEFGDPWLFHLLAETGQLNLEVMRDRVDSQYYDLIVTTSELERPEYDSYEFALPTPLVERLRARYARAEVWKGMFLYRRRPTVGPKSP